MGVFFSNFQLAERSSVMLVGGVLLLKSKNVVEANGSAEFCSPKEKSTNTKVLHEDEHFNALRLV